MKAQREAADKAMASKLKRLGASGDYKVNGKGGSKAYAAGGRVKGYAFGGAPMGADTDMDGSGPSGAMPKPNLGKPGMKHGKGKGKKGGKGHTINIVNLAPGGDKGGPPMMGPPGPLPGGPPGGMPPMPPKPPMPPMGAGPGGPPMPGGPGGGPPMLRKNGGRIGRKFGGSIKMSGDASPVKGKKGC